MRVVVPWATMLVEIGPVPADSARAYVALCRERLPALGADRRLDATLTPDVRARFDELLDAWESAATDDVFLWSADVDPDVVEHVFFAFFQVVRRVPALFSEPDEAGAQIRAPFRVALTNAVLDALEAEGKGHAELAETLRETWPADDIT